MVCRVQEVLQVEAGREEAHESAGACEMSDEPVTCLRCARPTV